VTPPSSLPYRFHPAAEVELRAAVHWYRERSPSTAEAFVSAIDAALEAIVERPAAWPLRAGRGEVRAFPLERFPFSVVYRARPSSPIRILAIAHARRRAGYWRDRR
jgi:toxin ParE1/3/4